MKDRLKRYKRQNKKSNIYLIRVLMERLENTIEEAMFKEIMVGIFARQVEICVLTITGSTIYTKQDK